MLQPFPAIIKVLTFHQVPRVEVDIKRPLVNRDLAVFARALQKAVKAERRRGEA